MEDLKITNLTAAKICHEIANYLSVIKFLQDDIKTNDSPEAQEFIKNIDLLSYTMDFFRAIYSSPPTPRVLEIIKNICNLKNIDIKIPSEIILESEANEKINAIGIILYILSKICKPEEKIRIEVVNQCINIIKDGSTTIPSNIIEAINESSTKENIFNILACYAKILLENIGYKIKIYTDNILTIKIWK